MHVQLQAIYIFHAPSMQDGWTPLALACDMGNSKIVKTLLDYGANVNQQNNVSKTEILCIYILSMKTLTVWRVIFMKSPQN